MSDQRPGVLRLMEQQHRNGSPVREIVEQHAAISLDDYTTDTELSLPYGLSYDDWERIGAQLYRWQKSWQWWFADWLNYGEASFGEQHAQAIGPEHGLAEQYINNIRSVARIITPDMRRPGLPFSYHAAVTKLPKERAVALLQQADEERWPREQLRDVVVKHGGDVDAYYATDALPPAVDNEPEACRCCCHGEVCRDCGKPTGPLE